MEGPMVTLAAGKSFLTAAAMTCAAEWRMRPSPSGVSAVTGVRVRVSVVVGTGAVRSRSVSPALQAIARLEAFSAQSLFQSIRTGRPVGDLNHFFLLLRLA